MEIDDDEDESGEPLTCIKHVTFTPQHAPNDIFRVNQVDNPIEILILIKNHCYKNYLLLLLPDLLTV